MKDFSKYKKIVIKIGSALSVDPDTYQFRSEWLETLFADIARLRKQGVQVVLVTSGSIAAGCMELKIKREDLSLTDMQAVASYGQTFLINYFREVANLSDVKISQLLITSDDCQDRSRFLNMRNSIARLANFDIVPVINENDAVITDEIRFSDNDILSSRVVPLVNADLLVILSDVTGLYDKNPKLHDDAKLITEVTEFADAIFDLANEEVKSLGTGGMKSKLSAAQFANKNGADALIISGKVSSPLSAYEGSGAGTFFKAEIDNVSAWKSWISGLSGSGEVVVDAGAIEALRSGSSLLAAGIKSVSGSFQLGDPVMIRSEAGGNVAIGLVAFDAKEIAKIKGFNSKDFANILGYPCKKTVIHADDIALV